MKCLYVEFSNGNVYKISCEQIAKSRAYHYAIEVDQFEKDSKEYWDEYKYSLGNDADLLDWAHNNMNWEDVEEFSELVYCVDRSDYHKEWSNAHKQIKEAENTMIDKSIKNEECIATQLYRKETGNDIFYTIDNKLSWNTDYIKWLENKVEKFSFQAR
jgi:hypothetical protein